MLTKDRLFGAEGVILNDCIMYGRILFASLTAFMVQNLYQTFLVTNIGLLFL